MGAFDEAIRGPMSTENNGLMGDGFVDFVYWTWPYREGSPRLDYPVGGDPLILEDEPFAVLVWRNHRSSPRPVVERAVEVLTNLVTYRLG